jgi:hypothetical protein
MYFILFPPKSNSFKNKKISDDKQDQESDDMMEEGYGFESDQESDEEKEGNKKSSSDKKSDSENDESFDSDDEDDDENGDGEYLQVIKMKVQ